MRPELRLPRISRPCTRPAGRSPGRSFRRSSSGSKRTSSAKSATRCPSSTRSPPTPAPAACLDPPSEEEVWHKVPKFKNGSPPFYETQRNNVRILIEKIGEKIDPCKIYPLAGPCQLVHCHYKCTVYYDELYWSDYPIPFNHVDHKVEVVYLDKDHLRRCGGPPAADTPPAPIGVNPCATTGYSYTRSGPTL